MMRLERRASLLVAFSLLTSAATAHAECAWVLWAATGGAPISEEWSVVQGMATAQQCDTSLRSHLKHAATVATSTVTDNVVTTKIAGTIIIIRFLCLPDTVDPRGPKEK
jgi:hypothetical protein